MPTDSVTDPPTDRAPTPPATTIHQGAASPGLHDAILAWYAVRGRDLAFRATTDPYAILVSEAMAQQTQAARAAEYWTRFLVEFPTIHALAAASPAAVLRAWRGLGYNRRAIALRQAALAIVRDHGGHVPEDIEALQALPGVGPYTARAIAALAYGRRVGAVDVNVRRVLARAIGGSLDAYTTAELQVVADASVPRGSPGVWTHALMDVGATFCKPHEPRCEACPARSACRYVLEAASGREQASEVTSRSTASTASGPNDPARAPRRLRERSVPFVTTSRWLRGRILDLLRDFPDGTWALVPPSIGRHDDAAIANALAGLEREGMVERHPSDPTRARLPIA